MLLSIIIPVYNLETYIERCIKSCLEQNIDDYEIILVNDGSKDGSAEILNSYASQYPQKIKVFHKENGGVSSARNLGIEKSQGDWIWFVDGDDWIANNCLKALGDQLKLGDCDFLRFGAIKTDDTSESLVFKFPIEFVKVTGNDIFDNGIAKTEYDCLWNYWFLRKKIVDNRVEFELKMKYAEDIKFVLEYKAMCDSGFVTSACLYSYYQRETSAIHNINHNNHLLCTKTLVQMCSNLIVELKDENKIKQYSFYRITFVKMFLWDLMLYGESYKFIKYELNELISYTVDRNTSLNGRNKKEKIANCMYRRIFPNKFLYLLVCRIRTILKQQR